MNIVANFLEGQMRKGRGQAAIHTDVANPASDPQRYADPGMEKMRALAWQGANDVRMGSYHANLLLNDTNQVVSIQWILLNPRYWTPTMS